MKSAPKEQPDDPAMAKVRAIWAEKQEAGWTQQKLGEAMGYGVDSARKSISQFLRSKDPQISMLRRFAKAVKVSLATIVKE
jgi:transcriptional regulator with XRE-family HTH domain